MRRFNPSGKYRFKDVRTRDLPASRIDGWSEFHLDINEDGTVYKPGSLYMEGEK
jgi:hypothetical protein